MKKAGYAVVFLGMLVALPGFADVIYDNGAPDWVTGYASNLEPDDLFLEADEFWLEEGASTLAGIHWWGVNSYSPGEGSTLFGFIIYDDYEGLPGNVVWQESAEVARQWTGNSTLQLRDIYAYDYCLSSPLTLEAGVTYHLSIVSENNDNSEGTWFWATHSFEVGSHSVGGTWEGATWGPIESELAFYLTGPDQLVVPEPASVSLLGVGLAGLAIRRFRRKH